MRPNSSALLLPLLFFGVCPLVRALEIESASPVKTEKGKRADFVFSGGITVKNIAFENGAVLMPASRYKDRTYADIKLLSKALYLKIEDCFLKNKCRAAVKPPAPVFSAAEVRPLRSKARAANISLDFDGDLLVSFGAVRKASGEFWAAFPDDFSAPDRALRKKIEAAVLAAAEKKGVWKDR